SFQLPPNCPSTSVSADCPNTLGQTFHAFTVWPHMHVKGRALTTMLKHAGAADQLVTDRPTYDFGAQYLEPASFLIQPNDTLTTRCTWDTTGATGNTPWGESTSQEMCFNFIYLYP